MTIKGAKTIAEYAIRRWLLEQGFSVDCFSLSMEGNVGEIRDKNNDTLILEYDPDTRSVNVKED